MLFFVVLLTALMVSFQTHSWSSSLTIVVSLISTFLSLKQKKHLETEEWNLDRCDGTGKSGYSLDVTKMQMFYMDYSWYGAGFIHWGFRAADGDVIYAHKIPNNNFNTEAYMSSGNLPARYEVNTICPSVTATTDISSGGSILYVEEAPELVPRFWNSKNQTDRFCSTADIEYINYTGTTHSNKMLSQQKLLAIPFKLHLPLVFKEMVFSQLDLIDHSLTLLPTKTYYVASVLSGTLFTITDTASSTYNFSK